MPRTKEATLREVLPNERVLALVVHVEELGAEATTRVVDQHVDLNQRRPDLGQPGCDLSAVPDVEHAEVHATPDRADLVGARPEVFDVPITDRDVSAEPGQRDRRRPTNADCSSGDDGHPAVEPHVVGTECHGAEVSGGERAPDAHVICWPAAPPSTNGAPGAVLRRRQARVGHRRFVRHRRRAGGGLRGRGRHRRDLRSTHGAVGRGPRAGAGACARFENVDGGPRRSGRHRGLRAAGERRARRDRCAGEQRRHPEATDRHRAGSGHRRGRHGHQLLLAGPAHARVAARADLACRARREHLVGRGPARPAERSRVHRVEGRGRRAGRSRCRSTSRSRGPRCSSMS